MLSGSRLKAQDSSRAACSELLCSSVLPSIPLSPQISSHVKYLQSLGHRPGVSGYSIYLEKRKATCYWGFQAKFKLHTLRRK